MGKTRAEIQKAYRERLKEKNNEGYLKKERERRKRNYIPSSDLTKQKREERNRKNREILRRFYKREKDKRMQDIQVDETSGYESGATEASIDSSSKLLVRLDFPSKRASALKRWRRELSVANKHIKRLENERDNVLRKFKSAQRAVQRMKKSARKNDSPTAQFHTPRKQTEILMEEASLTHEQKQRIRRPLLLGNVLADNIKASKENTKTHKVKSIHRVISGKIIKKYRCASMLSKKTGLCRHRLTNEEINSEQKQPGRLSKVKKHTALVVKFFEREDNSRVQPGKTDAKKVGKGKGNSKQIHVLTDYLKNLYIKFCSENPEVRISFTSFTRARPKHVLLTSFISRHSCLCIKHQNAALTVKALRTSGITMSQNPERVLQDMPSSQTIRNSLENTLHFGQWKRIQIEEKGKKKYVTKIVQKTVTKEEMITHFDSQMQEFKLHVARVTTQYEQIRHLKEHLQPNHIILQMDFAENYSCKSLDEVQSAYFNQTNVTLHPVVAYYRDPQGNLLHKSFIIVSDEMAHRSSTVLAFIEMIMPDLKSIVHNLDTIHYWTDSPSSQYRNKFIFHFIANHEDIYAVKAIWNYFETGHGKGPCDGLGGTCKRLADQAVRSGKSLIQDAEGFFEWAKHSSMSNVTFKYVPSSKCIEFEDRAKEKNLLPIKGTMKIHAVAGQGESHVKVRETSCYCENCLHGNMCDSWKSEKVQIVNTKVREPNDDAAPVSTTEPSPVDKSCTIDTLNHYSMGDFVAAVYDQNWYIGEIVDVDDLECEITFMEKKKQYYQWPRQQDRIWVNSHTILCCLTKPVATGTSKRMYKLNYSDEELVTELFAAYTPK